MSDSEQRAYTRFDVNHEFESIEDFLTEYVSDISYGGVFIRSKAPLPVGTRVQLHFTVIVDDVESIEGEGEVVRVSAAPQSGMGVVFTKLTPQSEQVIERLLAGRKNAQPVVTLVEDDES